jgi:hypothetical protein
MLKTYANLIEELIAHDQRTGLTYGDQPRFEVRQEPLLHHFSSSFLPENRNRSEGACAALFAVPVENVSGSRPGSGKRTGPALIHNQLVDRSLQTNVCHETSCYEFKIVIAASSRSASSDSLALEFGILPAEICDRPPFLKGVVGHSQLECLNPSFAFARKLPAQLKRIPVGSGLWQEEARAGRTFLIR